MRKQLTHDEQHAYYLARRNGQKPGLKSFYRVMYDPTDSLIPGMMLSPQMARGDAASGHYDGLRLQQSGRVYVVEAGRLVEARQ